MHIATFSMLVNRRFILMPAPNAIPHSNGVMLNRCTADVGIINIGYGLMNHSYTEIPINELYTAAFLNRSRVPITIPATHVVIISTSITYRSVICLSWCVLVVPDGFGLAETFTHYYQIPLTTHPRYNDM